MGTPAIIAALLSWRNSTKIDDNTEVTKAGTKAAIVNAKTAADNAKTAAIVAAEAKEAATSLAGQFNGALDSRISKIVKEHTEPLAKAFLEHNDQDQRNMDEIRKSLLALQK